MRIPAPRPGPYWTRLSPPGIVLVICCALSVLQSPNSGNTFGGGSPLPATARASAARASTRVTTRPDPGTIGPVRLASGLGDEVPPGASRRRIVPPDPDEVFDDLDDAGAPADEDLFTPEFRLPDAPTRDELLNAGLARESDPLFSVSAPPIDWQDFSPELEYETTPLFTLRDDLREFLPTLYADSLAMFTWQNAFILGSGAGLAIGLRENVDGEVRAWTAEHPERWGDGTQVLREFGEYRWQIPVILGGYTWSLWSQNAHFHEFMNSTICTYAINGLTTVAIKGLTNTSRPTDVYENGEYGFPSFHASSTFSIAANIDSYYGWKAGVPAYVLAGLVSWSRIDQREHDLSDVVFGSILGFTIGKTVAAAHQSRAAEWQLIPYFDASRETAGVSFDLRY